MAIKAIDLRRGMAVSYRDGGIWVCQDNQKVAKGNWRSYQVIQLKNFRTGQSIEERFRTDEPFEEIYLNRRPMEYLYTEGNKIVVMDPQSYEQIEIPMELIGDRKVFLVPNITMEVASVEGQPISVELPNVVELKIVETPPQLRGATATNQLKEATCEHGARIKVPGFVEIGETVRVDTRTGEYLSRA
jgi:elongation factor P